jgi:hypothetical protein
VSNPLKPSRWLHCKTYLRAFTAPLRWPFDRWQTRRENRAFDAGLDSAWMYCASIWDRPYVDAWCQLIHTPIRPTAPRPNQLLSRFQREFAQHQEFILAQTRSKNPILAAYAAQLITDPDRVPDDLRQRSEIIRLRDWYYEARMPLGEWIERVTTRQKRELEY